MTSERKQIQLTLLNGTGFIFDADDYMYLRVEHRIVGASVGTSCTRGWSVNESTMPVELTHCETRLLLEQGIATLVSKQQSLLRAPSAEEVQSYQTKMEAQIGAQAETLKAEKLKEATRNIDKIIRGKRKKLLKEGIKEEDIKLQQADILQEISNNVVFERKNALLDIPCAHYEPHTAFLVDLIPDNSLKYRVFCDFWSRGKYVTSGDAFGADFLLYPGDPLLYHASHIVILLAEPKVLPLELIAKTRLSVIVNKICIFAYFVAGEEQQEPQEVHYQTVQWEGNHDKDKLDEIYNQ